MRPAHKTFARTAALAAACSTSLALVACGGGGGGEAAASPEEERERMQEAGLKFAKCMRENGVDMPDPNPKEGGIRIGGPDSDIDVRDPAFQRAEEECRHHLEDAAPEISDEEQAEMRENMLAFARCMREQGIDFPDPTFDEGGRVTMRLGGPDGDGPRPDDPAFRRAADACREENPAGRGGPGVFMAP